MSVRPATLAVIEAAHRFSPVYRNGMASHLPMALVALDAMGADDARIEGYFASYSAKLEPMGDSGRVDELRRRIATLGASAVLAGCVPRLAPGIGSAAFHGAIRTAYALESGSDAEHAHGLAYWDRAFDPLDAAAVPAGDRHATRILAEISRDPARAGKRMTGQSIAGRMAAAIRLPDFPRWIAATDPRTIDLDSLAAALIGCYAASGDFTILHGVTGVHAARLLAPYFGDAEAVKAHLWRAVLAAYVGCGAPPLEGWGLEGSDALDWEEVHAAAVLCDDEHDIKLAYSCWREWQRTGEDLYRRAASARVAHAVQSSPRGKVFT